MNHDDITLLFTPGRVRDIIHTIDENEPWEKKETTTITLPAGESPISQGILLTRPIANATVNELTKDHIGETIMIKGRTHMITSISEKVRKSTSDITNIMNVVLPIITIIGLLALSLSIIPGVIGTIGDPFITITLIIAWIATFFKTCSWAVKKIVSGDDNDILIEAVPVWSRYRDDLTTVTNHLPEQREDFIESVQAACIYGNSKMLHEANLIVTRAENNWRLSHGHPEDTL